MHGFVCLHMLYSLQGKNSRQVIMVQGSGQHAEGSQPLLLVQQETHSMQLLF